VKRSNVADDLSEEAKGVGLELAQLVARNRRRHRPHYAEFVGATNLSSLCQSTRMCLVSRGLSSGRWDEIVIRDQLDAFTREHVTGGGQG
jgi:hypothetical protein